MIITLIKKEVKENFFAMKGVLWLFVIALLFSGLTYSIITVKELSLLAQTEVIVTIGKMIFGVGILVSLILASVSFSNEKEQSTIESLMLTPISGMELAIAKLAGVLIMWLTIYLVSIPYVLVLSYGTGMGIAMIIFVFLCGTAVICFYGAIGISLSIIMGTSKNAMITSIIFFLITGIPAFLSTTMKKAGFGMILDRISPLSNTLNLMKEVIINRQGLAVTLQFIIPLLLFVILGYIILSIAIKGFNFEGGE